MKQILQNVSWESESESDCFDAIVDKFYATASADMKRRQQRSAHRPIALSYKRNASQFETALRCVPKSRVNAALAALPHQVKRLQSKCKSLSTTMSQGDIEAIHAFLDRTDPTTWDAVFESEMDAFLKLQASQKKDRETHCHRRQTLSQRAFGHEGCFLWLVENVAIRKHV